MGKLGQIPFWEWLPGRSWRIVGMVEAADEIPIKLPLNGAVIVGSLRNPKWLAFECPCKTGHRIMINLDATNYPRWIFHGEKKLSVTPSVDYRVPGRRCHYFIRSGKVIWIKEKKERRYDRKI